jgi:short-subunit dehydrogenase
MNHQPSLAGKTAVVSGASKGLGHALALRLSERGTDLVLLARDSTRLDQVAAESRDRGIRCDPIACDLSKPGEIAAACARIKAIGGVDILINNAGHGYYKPFLDHSPDEHDAIIDVNIRALIHLTHRLLPSLLQQGSGHIVNIASDVSSTPIANMAVYAASKFAVRGFTLSLAREIKDKGIKVSLINPGIIDTAFNESEPGTKDPSWSLRPDELAALIITVLEQPGYQMVDELTVHPRMQEY